MELFAGFGYGYQTVRINDRAECRNVVGGSDEIVGIGIRKRTSADGGNTVLNLALVGNHAAAFHDTDAVGSGVPCAHDYLLVEAHLSH